MANEKCKECKASLVLDEEELCAYCELNLGENVNKSTDENTPSVDCGVCYLVVEEDSEGLFCDVCETWFHNECIKTPLHYELYALLNDAPQNVKWFCDKCIWETEKWIKQRIISSREMLFTSDKQSKIGKGSVSNLQINKKELFVKLERLDMTIANIPSNKKSLNTKSLPKENPSSDGVCSESDINEKAKMIISNEIEYYNDSNEFIFNENNYVDCQFKDCSKILFIEHTKKHLQNHEKGLETVISHTEQGTGDFLCGECGQILPSFDTLSDHIFNHFKTKIPNEKVCTCGYKSKRLSLFKFHKCINVKELRRNPKKSNKSYKLASYQEYDQSEISDLSDDQEYNPPGNCDMNNDSDDSEYNFPSDTKMDKDSERINSKIKKKKDHKMHQGEGMESKKKGVGSYFNKIKSELKIFCKRCKGKFENGRLYRNHLIECKKTFSNSVGSDKMNMQYCCNQCDYISYRNQLLTHLKRVHGNVKDNSSYSKWHIMRYKNKEDSLANLMVTCTSCNDKFDNTRLFYDHLKKNEKNCDEKQNLIKKEINEFGTRFLCVKCDETFDNRAAAESHLYKRHPIIKYHCDKCDFVSFRMQTLFHMKSVHVKDVVCCPKCNQTYANKTRLKVHMKRMHSSDPNKNKAVCNICGNLYSKSRLKEHMLIHSDNKPFPCKLCNFSTTKKYNLDVHMKTHNKDGSKVYNRTLEKSNTKKYNILEKPQNTYNKNPNVTAQHGYFDLSNYHEKEVSKVYSRNTEEIIMKKEIIAENPRNALNIYSNVTPQPLYLNHPYHHTTSGVYTQM